MKRYFFYALIMIGMHGMIHACENDGKSFYQGRAHEIYKETLALQLRAEKVQEKKHNKNLDFNIILSPQVFETPLQEIHALIEKKDWTDGDVTKLEEYDRKIGRWQANVLQDEKCCNVCCESEANIARLEEKKKIVQENYVRDMQKLAYVKKAACVTIPIVSAVLLWLSMKYDQKNNEQCVRAQ